MVSEIIKGVTCRIYGEMWEWAERNRQSWQIQQIPWDAPKSPFNYFSLKTLIGRAKKGISEKLCFRAEQFVREKIFWNKYKIMCQN